MQTSGKLVLFLRDINLPKADKYGTSQVMAFLQQLLTYQGFYNKLEFVGKPPISARFVCSICQLHCSIHQHKLCL